jgi:hypothetical protein
MAVFLDWNAGYHTNTAYFTFPGSGTTASWRLTASNPSWVNDVMDSLEALFHISTRTLKDVARINPHAGGINLTTDTTTGAGYWYDGNVTAQRAFVGMEASSDASFRVFSGAVMRNVFSINLAGSFVTVMPANGTVPTPAANNFNLYVDPADNKLKAKGSGGNVTILATP